MCVHQALLRWSGSNLQIPPGPLPWREIPSPLGCVGCRGFPCQPCLPVAETLEGLQVPVGAHDQSAAWKHQQELCVLHQTPKWGPHLLFGHKCLLTLPHKLAHMDTHRSWTHTEADAGSGPYLPSPKASSPPPLSAHSSVDPSPVLTSGWRAQRQDPARCLLHPPTWRLHRP